MRLKANHKTQSLYKLLVLLAIFIPLSLVLACNNSGTHSQQNPNNGDNGGNSGGGSPSNTITQQDINAISGSWISKTAGAVMSNTGYCTLSDFIAHGDNCQSKTTNLTGDTIEVSLHKIPNTSIQWTFSLKDLTQTQYQSSYTVVLDSFTNYPKGLRLIAINSFSSNYGYAHHASPMFPYYFISQKRWGFDLPKQLAFQGNTMTYTYPDTQGTMGTLTFTRSS